MKYIAITLFALFLMPQAEARQYTHYGHVYQNASDVSFASCRRQLRRAGYLARGRGARVRNFHVIDACVRNGGRI